MAYPGYEGYASADPYAGYGYAPPAPAYPAYGGVEEVRTVFITGFPADVKERELNNLLRFLPGYEASQMNWKNGQAQGFALFNHGAAARQACESIGHLSFDDNVFLRAEIAHKNMYIKDESAAKRTRTVGAYGGASSYGAPPAPGRPVGYAPVSNVKDNPPCNTLFVGNLGDTVDEGELTALFSTQPGYSNLKLIRGSRNVSCFVEFDTTENATACHTSQQGAVLTSSDRGGIRIQYSRNPFGKKRDVNGNLVDTRGAGTAAAGGAYGGATNGGAYDVNAPPGTS